jgi:hypothetical protein
LVLTQARCAVVRAYLVGNFGFDDTQLKTLGMGKKIDATASTGASPAGADSGWGDVQFIVYPVGTAVPAGQ